MDETAGEQLINRYTASSNGSRIQIKKEKMSRLIPASRDVQQDGVLIVQLQQHKPEHKIIQAS